MGGGSSVYMSLEDRYSSKAVVKYPVVITRGKGAIVWDEEGREYIDCIGGHGACIVGHCHPKIVNAIKKQAERLILCTQELYNDVRAEFLKKLISIMPKELSRVFIGNSGTEAVECAIKLARKYTKKKGIISTMRAFHGRTLGALSATWDPKYRAPFEPLVPGFSHVKFGDAEAIERAITDDTAAIIIEPIQGEGGVYVAPDGYLKEVREICDKHGVLLILDEVQTGFGRTGKMFAFQHWGIVPDIVTLAKGIAGGFPMGATVAKEEIMLSFERGEHGTTFGGNPIACAAGSATIDVIIEEKLPERSYELGKYFIRRLEELKEKYEIIRENRGMGLMIGTELRVRCQNILNKAMEKGLLLLSSGLNILRFLPPLVITKEQIDKAIFILEESLRSLS